MWLKNHHEEENQKQTPTDQDNFLLQEADVDVVDVHVHLVRERDLFVASSSNVLPSNQQGHQVALQIVVLSQDVGVRALEVICEPIKGSIVRVSRDTAPVKL